MGTWQLLIERLKYLHKQHRDGSKGTSMTFNHQLCSITPNGYLELHQTRFITQKSQAQGPLLASLNRPKSFNGFVAL
jgi:hypothetical protein